MRARIVLVGVLGLLAGNLTHAMRLCGIAQHDIGASRETCAHHRAASDASHPSVPPGSRSSDGAPACCSPTVALAGVVESRIVRDQSTVDRPSMSPLPIGAIDSSRVRAVDARTAQRSRGAPPGHYAQRRHHLTVGILII